MNARNEFIAKWVFDSKGFVIGTERKEDLIRCKDCIYWKRYCRVVDGVTSHHVCGRKRELDGLMYRTKADDFCSWAERREE